MQIWPTKDEDASLQMSEKFQNQPQTLLRVDTADCFKYFSIRYFYVLGDTWTKIILLLINGPNQQPINEQLTMTIWHYCYILFQLYECYKRLGQLLYAWTSYRIYITCRYIVYSEYYGIRMAKLMKTWLKCPECHEWYHKSCVRIPPTAHCAIPGDIDNYTM